MSHEEVDVFLVGVESVVGQGFRDFWSRDPTFGILINDLEGIHQVEVGTCR